MTKSFFHIRNLLSGKVSFHFDRAHCRIHKIYILIRVIASGRSGRRFYQQSYIGRLDNIQAALKPKKSEKIKIQIYEHFKIS